MGDLKRLRTYNPNFNGELLLSEAVGESLFVPEDFFLEQRQIAETAVAFDEDGYYLIGDAGRFVDPADPGKGISFAGRVAEDFKLISGTWVRVGLLWVDVLTAAAPLIQSALVTGHDRE